MCCCGGDQVLPVAAHPAAHGSRQPPQAARLPRQAQGQFDDQAAPDPFTHSGFKVGGWDQVDLGAVFFAGTTRTRRVTR
jgi:hypothetical protein